MADARFPYRFPNQADEIYERAQAFRRLAPTDRFLAIVDLIASGLALMESSPQRETAARLRADREEEWRRIHKELFARHGH